MSERERDAFERAVKSVAAVDPLTVAHPATTQTQSINGNVSIQIDEGGPMPGASDVPCVYGLPGTTCKVPQGTRARMSFDNGDPRKRTFGTYDAGCPVTEINFAGASSGQGAARNGDSVGGGSLTWVQGPPAAGIPTGGVLTYLAFPSIANPTPTPIVWLVAGPIVITQVSPLSATPTMQLGGAIDGGSSVVKIGG